jgi:predicted permease
MSLGKNEINEKLLTTFYAAVQINILVLVGVITAYKKIWSPKSIKAVSELLVNFFMPIYMTLEVARMSSWPNVEIMWILIITVVICILSGFAIGILIHRLFQLDVRFKFSYPILTSMPYLATLPLVFGKALCYPGGILEGDPQCANMVGFMMLNFLIFQIMLFLFGFILMPKDSNFTNDLMEKMSYTWHIIIGKIHTGNIINQAVMNMFLRFMKDEKTALKLFEIFEKKYKLELIDKGILRYKFTENYDVELDFLLDSKNKLCYHSNTVNGQQKNINQQHVLLQIKEESSIKKEEDNEDYFEKKSTKSIKSNGTPPVNLGNSINLVPDELQPASLYHVTEQREIHDEILPTEYPFISERIFSVPHREIAKVNSPNKSSEEEDQLNKIKKSTSQFFSQEVNFVPEDLITDMESPRKKMTEVEEEKLLNQIEKRRRSSFELFSNDVELYYQKVFGFIEKHLNPVKANEFNEFKLNTEKAYYGNPPKFPIAKDIEITPYVLDIVNSEWEKFEKSVYRLNQAFKFTPSNFYFSFNEILNSLHSPPILGCLFGIMIGTSNMREILFSQSHYITNIFETFWVSSRGIIPFHFITIGVAIVGIKNYNNNKLNSPFNKKYVILAFIQRFIILPGLGLFYVYLWKTYYGGVIAYSKVVRISLFIPFCVPCSSSIFALVNMLKFFSLETEIIVITQNATMIVTLTFFYFIYYLLLG